MCDTKYQLPNSTYYPQPSVVHCAGCGGWHTAGQCYAGSGYALSGTATSWMCPKCGGMCFSGSVHHCTTAPRFGFATYPAPWVDAVAAKAALNKLAFELARLTKEMPQAEQEGVWAAYYELQKELTK